MVKTSSLLLILLFLSQSLFAQQKDVQGSKDHPLFSRVPGSAIIKYDFKEFDEAVLPLGTYKFFEETFEDKQRVEGAVYRIGYKAPSGRSTLEVIRSYKDALAEGDGQILYECSGEPECGNGFDIGLDALPGEEDLFSSEAVDGDSQRYLAARLSQSGQDSYVMVYTYYQYSTETPYVRFRVIETEAQQEELVTLNADAMRQALNTSGHIAVKGIHFDTDKATLRPASEPILKEMANLLNNNPDLQVYIVGHTDDTGAFDHNMQLSKQRAEAVAQYLSDKLKVNGNQLQADGAGPLAPVASNTTEAGRQQNRRVEMVKQVK